MPYCQVNGIRMRYETWGVGEVPLVLIHGLGSSADDWFLQLEAFAPHFRCIAVDLRGHGLSEKPAGPYSVQLFATDVALLLRQLNAWPAHVLGLSLGGMVAQQLAIAHPHVVRTLVLLNTLPGLWPIPGRMVASGARRLRVSWRGRQGTAESARVVADSLFIQREEPFFHSLVMQRILSNDPQAYRQATLAVARYRPGASLRRITAPVLIVAGDTDRVVAPLYQERLRSGIPHACFRPVPGGHACNIDHAAEVNQAVLSWLVDEADHAS